jgi:hypothetical protein
MEIVLAAGKGTLNLDESGILRLVWAAGSMLDTADAVESVVAISRISVGRMLPLLIDISDVKLTAGARNHYLESRFVSSVALVGESNVDRVVAAWMRRGSDCPQCFFTSRAEALGWLGELAASDGPQSVAG